MKARSILLAVFLLVTMTGGSLFAQACTCGCGKDISQCDASCAVASSLRQPRRRISVLGNAKGQSAENKPFGYADTAQGVVRLNVMGRKDIRNLNANWHATFLRDAPDASEFSPAKRQVWQFVAEPDPAGNDPGDLLGTARITLTGDENGASGTATGWKVVTNTGTLLKVKFQVQFVGDKLQLTGFAEDVSK